MTAEFEQTLTKARTSHSNGRTMLDKALPNRLKDRRLAHHWTQGDLAVKAGISRTAVSAIEKRRLVPSVATALSLASVLGCTVENLFGPERAENNVEPAWAFLPAPSPCRYWNASVGGRVLLFPAESPDAGLLEHDGLFVDGSFLTRQPFAPEKTLVMACCDPAAGLLVRQLAQATGIRLLVLSRSSRESLALLDQRRVHVAGVHLATVGSTQGNTQAVREELGSGYSLVRLAHWQEGLALAPHLRLRTVRATVQAKLRWVGRAPGSGARQCLDEIAGPKTGAATCGTRSPHSCREHPLWLGRRRGMCAAGGGGGRVAIYSCTRRNLRPLFSLGYRW
jgi:DNA-binding XRE family transcriptional regulator